MKILITGTRGLASALHQCYSSQHEVVMVSRSTGYDIKNINNWGHLFVNFDMVFNNAYDQFYQIDVLEFFYNQWKDNTSKTIISIGSRCICYNRTENINDYWPYRIHKQTLQLAHDSMQIGAKCDLKIFNPGPIDTQMISHLSISKLDAQALAEKIKVYTQDRYIKRIDMWI